MWYNVALAAFLFVAIGLAATIMNSGFSSSEVTKEVLMEALKETRHGIQIMGKISAAADVTNNELLTTSTPISVANGGSLSVVPTNLELKYKLIKIDSHTITYENINAGVLNEGSYNSIRHAIKEAKNQGIIDINPYEDEQKPHTTSAFIYWLINHNEDTRIDDSELAVLAIVYAEQDRPATAEFLQVEGFTPEGRVFMMERDIPNITSSIVDLGGKLQPKE